ncbi:hypothetical protein JTE90_020247 [Oedothorax gibbosus]|uniref:Uncharacterized protein n=1 Tax=Oedothorax gibbosus TaxID=931172 RepID=A0AAV6THQ3_9ARAC|nr:hypothetical protein JTE90_020247 [Oedothorax gibbosus]
MFRPTKTPPPKLPPGADRAYKRQRLGALKTDPFGALSRVNRVSKEKRKQGFFPEGKPLFPLYFSLHVSSQTQTILKLNGALFSPLIFPKSFPLGWGFVDL